MEKIDLSKLFNLIFKYIIVVVICTAGGAWLAREYTDRYITKNYSSTVQVIAPLGNQKNGDATGEIDKNIRLITTYADVVRSSAVLKEIAKEIDGKTTKSYSANDLYHAITVDHNSDSQVFGIKATATNPDDAAVIANTTFSVFKHNIQSLLGVTNIRAISKGVANRAPDSPNLILNILIGATVGFLLALGILVGIDYRKRSRKSRSSVLADLEITELGKVSTISLRQLHRTRRELIKTSVEKQQIDKGEKMA